MCPPRGEGLSGFVAFSSEARRGAAMRSLLTEASPGTPLPPPPVPSKKGHKESIHSTPPLLLLLRRCHLCSLTPTTIPTTSHLLLLFLTIITIEGPISMQTRTPQVIHSKGVTPTSSSRAFSLIQHLSIAPPHPESHHTAHHRRQRQQDNANGRLTE